MKMNRVEKHLDEIIEQLDVNEHYFSGSNYNTLVNLQSHIRDSVADIKREIEGYSKVKKLIDVCKLVSKEYYGDGSNENDLLDAIERMTKAIYSLENDDQ